MSDVTNLKQISGVYLTSRISLYIRHHLTKPYLHRVIMAFGVPCPDLLIAINGKFHLINVARWRSADDFKNATAKMREALPDNQVEGVVFYPSLFKVIESDMPFGRKMGK